MFWDPFRVFFEYDDYYTENYVTGNREDVCLKLLNKRKITPTSYIIGSSRSLAFKTQYWSKKIASSTKLCFHYDGSGMGLYRTTNALKFLGSNNVKIKNILLIVDTDFFGETHNPKGHLFIQHPRVSGQSKITYYWTFIKASIDPEFIFYNLIFKISRNYYGFMGHHIAKSKFSHVSNNMTADLSYSYDKEIEQDSVKYYHNLLKEQVFYRRDFYLQTSRRLIKKKQLKLLKEIKEITSKNNTNVKLIISPLYNQIAFNKRDLEELKKIFGMSSVYDFSGKNTFTYNFKNYYESSHYKPFVANKLMDIVYANSQKSN